MGRHLMLVAHLSADDVGRRYRTAKQAVERTWWQIVWLVSQGQTATAIARSTGYSRGWVCQVAKRYNALGPEGLHDRRQPHSRRQAPALSEEQQAELRAVLEGPPPRGELWTGRLVAEWMSERLGRPLPRQLGWVYLVRLDGRWRKPHAVSPSRPARTSSARPRGSIGGPSGSANGKDRG